MASADHRLHQIVEVAEGPRIRMRRDPYLRVMNHGDRAAAGDGPEIAEIDQQASVGNSRQIHLLPQLRSQVSDLSARKRAQRQLAARARRMNDLTRNLRRKMRVIRNQQVERQDQLFSDAMNASRSCRQKLTVKDKPQLLHASSRAGCYLNADGHRLPCPMAGAKRLPLFDPQRPLLSQMRR